MKNGFVFFTRFLGGVVILSLCLGLDVRLDSVESFLPQSTFAQAQKTQTGQNSNISNSRQNGITRAVAKVSPSVVGINVIQIKEYVATSPFANDPFFRNFFQGRRYRERVKGLGSGFFISKDGYILTNEHVISNAIEIVVTLPGGKEYTAEPIGSDVTSDIALLKINGNNFPTAELGDSDEIIIGEWAIALGNPFGLFDINSKPIVTVGVISALNQDFGRQANDRVYQDMMETDAAINGGNSGGPLVNSMGQVIGINTWIISGSETMTANIGLGFAIPINRVKRIIRDLKVYGKVDRSFWTGLEVEELSVRLAKYLGLPNWNGLLVASVKRNSPAHKAGLEENDVIIEVNGKSMKSRYDIWSVIENQDLRSGDILNLKVFRSGKYLNLKLMLERPRSKKGGSY